MATDRTRWYTDVIEAGLETKLLTEQDILVHMTPSVLAKTMPKDVLVRMFESALTSGSISPKAVVQQATPQLMAEHVAPDVVWSCLAAAADRAGITRDAGTPRDETSAREFLRRGLASALATGVLTAKDIVDEVNASVLGHLPDALTSKLLEAALAAGKLSPELVVDTLGTEAIAKHAPTPVLWSCFVTAGDASQPSSKEIIAEPPPPRPGTLEVLDDDVASVLVDLEDSAGFDPKSFIERPVRPIEEFGKPKPLTPKPLTPKRP
jgi:hypothetical protein